MPYSLYILRTSSNTLYIGQITNLETRNFDSLEFVYKEEYQTRKEAMQREWQLKKWSKAKKEALIKGDTITLKKL